MLPRLDVDMIALVDDIVLRVQSAQFGGVSSHAHAWWRNAVARSSAEVEAVRNPAHRTVAGGCPTHAGNLFARDASRGESYPTLAASDLPELA
jgi:hypothetical protein